MEHETIVQRIAVSALRDTGHNTRHEMDDLEALQRTMAEGGLVQPPQVVAYPDGTYSIVVGHRRVAAAQALGWETMDVLVVAAVGQALTHAKRLLENMHRRDLSPIEEAQALKLHWLYMQARVMDAQNGTDHLFACETTSMNQPNPMQRITVVTEYLESVGWSRKSPAISQREMLHALGLDMEPERLRKLLRVLALPEDVQNAAVQAGMSEAAMRSLAQLKDPEQQRQLVAAVQANPEMAGRVKSVVQAVTKRKRPIDEAITIAQGTGENTIQADPDEVATPTGEATLALLDAILDVQRKQALLVHAMGETPFPEPLKAYLQGVPDLMRETMRMIEGWQYA